MSIQGNINQGLSIASLLISQTPGYKQAAENRKITQKTKVLEEARDRIQDSNSYALGEDKKAEAEKISSEIHELRKQAFEVNPSRKNYDRLQQSTASQWLRSEISGMREAERLEAAAQATMRKKADLELAGQLESRRETRARAMGQPSFRSDFELGGKASGSSSNEKE